MDKEKQIAKLRADKENLTMMLDSPGWEVFTALIKGASVVQRNRVFSSEADGLDSLVRMGNGKAYSDGLMAALVLPEIHIEDAKADLAAFYEDEGKENNDT